MKTLVGIMGCGLHAAHGIHKAIRETWGNDAVAAHLHLRFFVGDTAVPLMPDEIPLECPDNKETLLYKVVEMCKFALRENYDYLFKVNTNTYVDIKEVLKRPPLNGLHTDYSGSQVGKIGEPFGEMGIHGWIQGAASWLSRNAMSIVLDDAIPYALKNMARLMPWNGIIAPYLHSEDLWIGQVLTPHLRELRVDVDQGYGNGPITWWSQSEYVKTICHPEWFLHMHKTLDRETIFEEYKRKG